MHNEVKPIIVLVDDDKNILTSVSLALEEEKFIVHCYSDGYEALDFLSNNPANLVVLDIKMPLIDGMELLERLRRSNNIPVIFLTSKDDEIDELMGLRMGADDYIRKPFSQRLLIERIRTLLRRDLQKKQETQHELEQNKIVRGHLMLDLIKHQCSWMGHNIELTVTEFLLLQSLVLRPGHVKTRDQLMDIAYGDTVYVDDRTIDSHIKRLRRKFKIVDQTFTNIETLYGMGYRYREN
ncbi:MAG: response regulator transcription factor [Alphaproteobacteria bacterium]|nr:response regulator transcription factor [Alphaproteobacteria bacterium]